MSLTRKWITPRLRQIYDDTYEATKESLKGSGYSVREISMRATSAALKAAQDACTEAEKQVRLIESRAFKAQSNARCNIRDGIDEPLRKLANRNYSTKRRIAVKAGTVVRGKRNAR